MGAGRGGLKAGRRIRGVLLLVLLIIALAIGGAAAFQRWPRKTGRDPGRLGLLSSALAEFNAGRHKQALALLNRRAAEVTPTALDWMLRARVAEAEGRPDEALAHLQHIPDSDPFAAQAWLKAGQIELARHRARAAEAAYRHALALNPDQIQSHRELAYLYAVQRRRAECDAQFRALDRLMPLDHTLAFAWSQNDCDLWDVPGARNVLIPFIAQDPADRDSRVALATGYARTNDLDQAEAALAPLPDSDPDARALRVQIAIDRGDLEAAERLLRDGPAGHARLDFFRGRLALHRNDPHRAADAFRSVLRQDPTDRDALDGLSVALRNLGDPKFREFQQAAWRHDQLKRTIKESVTTIDTDRRLFDKLGELCESLHLCRQARVWYRLAVGRDPLDTEAQQALARLNPTESNATAESTPTPERAKTTTPR
jgi:tetratricopeptide (TPR) repeat protein